MKPGGEHWTLRECTKPVGRYKWEVLHYWADGVTVAYKYFETKALAEKYLAGAPANRITREN